MHIQYTSLHVENMCERRMKYILLYCYKMEQPLAVAYVLVLLNHSSYPLVIVAHVVVYVVGYVYVYMCVCTCVHPPLSSAADKLFSPKCQPKRLQNKHW